MRYLASMARMEASRTESQRNGSCDSESLKRVRSATTYAPRRPQPTCHCGSTSVRGALKVIDEKVSPGRREKMRTAVTIGCRAPHLHDRSAYFSTGSEACC